MAASEKPEQCLICEVPITESHQGISCCRACSVFYKRTLAGKRKLRCKGGEGECLSKNAKTNCRKCRFERFSSILDACSEDNLDGYVPSDPLPASPISLPIPFLDHETSLQVDSSSSETPTLDRMRRSYRTLCMMRKNGEMGTCTTQVYSQLMRGTIKFAPTTYTNVMPNIRILFNGMIEFFCSSFDDFSKMTKANQHLILRSSFDMLQKTDNLYRSVHHFPDCDTLMPSYTTVFSADKVEEFLIDCPPEVNKEEAGAEFVKNAKRSLVVNKAHFKRVQLSGDEFLALLALGLWTEHASNEEDDLQEKIKRNRTVIMKELHKHYVSKGITDYASRLGDLFGLLVNMQKAGEQTKEDEQVYLLMNMFKEHAYDRDIVRP